MDSTHPAPIFVGIDVGKGHLDAAASDGRSLGRVANEADGHRTLIERLCRLAPELVAEAVSGLRTTELARAREVWQKKFGKSPQDAAERARQMRFLASRGFGGDTIHRVVSGGDDD